MAKRLSLWILALLFTGLTLTPVAAQQPGGQPGVFDYYVLTLSWSPEYCHSNATSPECTGGKHLGFVVHGLWPQFQNGGYPEHCSNAAGPSNPAQWLDIMPDLGLIQHEWTTHGTCSGLSPNDYFNLIRRVFQSVTIPSQFVAPASTVSLSPLQIKQEFEQANAGWKDAGIVVQCSGAYLKGLEVCLTKDGTPQPCSGIRDCTMRSVRVPPVQ